jgi:hypothetical protein
MTSPSEVIAPELTFSGDAETAQMTILVTGVSSGLCPLWIALPGAGKLQVIYEYQDQPAATAILWHQGGTYDKLIPGPNTYNSSPGDALYFTLAYEGQSIKVGWAYL